MEKDLHYKTLIFCAMTISAVCAVFWDKVAIVSVILLIFIGYSLYKKHFGKIFAGLLILFFILTLFYSYSRQSEPDLLTLYDKQKVTLEGKVASLSSKSTNDKTKFIFTVTNLTDSNNTNKDIKAKTLVYLNKSITTKVSRGDNLKLNAFISVPYSYNNPGEFNYGKYLANSDIYTLAFANNLEIVDKEPAFTDKILSSIDRTREKIINEHSKYLDRTKTEILGGVVFGSEAIKPSIELKNKFIESGLYHLLAASGMNVAFIFGIWFFILIRLKVPYKFVIISGGIVVLFYALMTGLPPSVTRATWMLELALLGKLIDRTSDNNVILLFVCALLLIFDPKLINDIGFLLSFMVTFGLINCVTPIMDKLKFIPAKVSGWFIIPFIAQIFAIPIQMYYFQTISLYSILANMLVIPFMAIISFCGFISSILALIPRIGCYICLALDKINEPFLNFMLLVADRFSALDNNIIQVAKLDFIEISIYYILIFVFIYMLKNKFKDIKLNIVATVLFVILSLSLVTKGYSDDLTFTFFNVGEADSIFIITPNNKKILVDTGRRYISNRNSGNSIILPYFKINGITDIDMMILTHPDSDHIAGSVDVLKNIYVNKIVMNGENAKNKAYLKLQEYINNNNLNVTNINELKEISPDKDVSIIAFKAKDTDKQSQNDTSIILIIKYKDFDGILMGDNEINSYELLKKNLNPSGKIELFKVGHHGSKNSVNGKMAELINPDVSIISVGENKYGHPHGNVFSCLKNSKIYRTDVDNTIKLKTDGNNYKVYTYNPKKSVWCVAK